MKDAASETPDKSTGALHGIGGVLKSLDKFFDSLVEAVRHRDSLAGRKFFQNLETNARLGKRFIEAGEKMLHQLTSHLESTQHLIQRIPGFEEGFQTATKGLKGIGALSEEATTHIQDTTALVQESLESQVTELRAVAEDDSLSDDARQRLTAVIEQVETVNEEVFNIMMELQFQDILRQQLAAISIILGKTKQNLGASLEKITGQPLDPWEVLGDDVVTDANVLQNGGSQDTIDDIINGVQ